MKGGQSREGVEQEHPDYLVEETVFEPTGFGPKTLQSPPDSSRLKRL